MFYLVVPRWTDGLRLDVLDGMKINSLGAQLLMVGLGLTVILLIRVLQNYVFLRFLVGLDFRFEDMELSQCYKYIYSTVLAVRGARESSKINEAVVRSGDTMKKAEEKKLEVAEI